MIFKELILFKLFILTIFIQILHLYIFQLRYRYGLYHEVSHKYGTRVHHCNWIRFLRTAGSFSSDVNLICTMVKGDPLYEVIKPIKTYQELVAYYLPERPEESMFMNLRSTLYRQAMDSILQGNY